MIPPPDAADTLIRTGVAWVRLAVELLGATVVAIGISLAAGLFAKALSARRPADFNAIRLLLSRYLAVALEFQLGADILSTAIAPTWTEIGKLGTIAVIRTGLNYFLSKKMAEEQRGERDQAERKVVSDAGA